MTFNPREARDKAGKWTHLGGESIADRDAKALRKNLGSPNKSEAGKAHSFIKAAKGAMGRNDYATASSHVDSAIGVLGPRHIATPYLHKAKEALDASNGVLAKSSLQRAEERIH